MTVSFGIISLRIDHALDLRLNPQRSLSKFLRAAMRLCLASTLTITCLSAVETIYDAHGAVVYTEDSTTLSNGGRELTRRFPRISGDRTVIVVMDANGVINRVVDDIGRQWTYARDPAAHITTVTRRDGPAGQAESWKITYIGDAVQSYEEPNGAVTSNPGKLSWVGLQLICQDHEIIPDPQRVAPDPIQKSDGQSPL